MNNEQFAIFNYDNLPKITVNLGRTIKNDNDYNKFINQWINAYKIKTKYYLHFDTRKTGYVNISYAYKFTNFINYIKKNANKLFGNQWLQYSIMLVNSNIIMYLLNIIFNISRPIAPIYIVNSIDTINIIDNTIKYLTNQYNNLDIISIYDIDTYINTNTNIYKLVDVDNIENKIFSKVNNYLDHKNITYKFINP